MKSVTEKQHVSFCSSEQRIVLDTLPVEAGLGEPAVPQHVLTSLAMGARFLAYQMLDRVEGVGGAVEVRCRECNASWLLGGIERRHRSHCAVAGTLQAAEIVLEALRVLPCGGHVQGLTHEERAAKVARESAFPTGAPGSRIVEVGA